MIFVIIACRINSWLSIFWFALWSIVICISSSPIHEIGHATAAKRCSRNIHTLISFWHTKFIGIEHVDSKHKKLIALAGAAFGEIYVLLFMFLIWLFYFANGINMLTACIIAFVAFTLLNLVFNLAPNKDKPNDGYYFLHPDEIKDEVFLKRTPDLLGS